MRRPTPAQLAFSLLALGLAAVLGYKLVDWLTGEETRVRRSLRALEAEAESLDVLGVLRYIDPLYKDSAGNTYDLVKAAIFMLFRDAEILELDYELRSVSIEGEKAVATVRLRGRLVREGETCTLEDAGLPGELFELELARFKRWYRILRVRALSRGDVGARWQDSSRGG